MELTINAREERGGRWVAAVREMPNIVVRGGSYDEAVALSQARALAILADQVRHNEALDPLREIVFIVEPDRSPSARPSEGSDGWLPHPPSRWREFGSLSLFILVGALLLASWGARWQASYSALVSTFLSFMSGYLFAAWRRPFMPPPTDRTEAKVATSRRLLLMTGASFAALVCMVLLEPLASPTLSFWVSAVMLTSVVVGGFAFGVSYRSSMTRRGRVPRIAFLRLAGDRAESDDADHASR